MPGVAHTGTDWDQQEARETTVPNDRCVWCKLPQDEWDEEIEAVPVGEEEIVCSNCLGDLREYGRYEKLQISVSSAFGPAVRIIVLDYLEELASELSDRFPDDPDIYYLTTELSNAKGTENLEHDDGEGSRIS